MELTAQQRISFCVFDPEAQAGKSGAIEVFENKQVPVFSVVTR